MKYRSRSLLAYLFSALLIFPHLAQTCGPYFPEVVFTRARHPDGPWNEFIAGRLGVVLPTWWRAYLVIAYRYFSGSPLNGVERDSMREWNPGEDLPPGDRQRSAETSGTVEEWLLTRGEFAKAPNPKPFESYKPLGDYASFDNCTGSAFRTAQETLRSRAQRFGTGSQELQEWIAGQDLVFQNCSQGSYIPSPLPANANEPLRKDREYQIAAANFYSGNWSEAIARFKAIGEDGNSPWQPMGKYLAARALLRQATLEEGSPREDRLLFAEARALLQASSADPRTSDRQRQMNERYLDLVNLREGNGPYLHEIGRKLAAGDYQANTASLLNSYTVMLDQIIPAEPDFPGVARWIPEYKLQHQVWAEETYTGMQEARSDDLTDWVITMQADADAARVHAMDQWRRIKSTQWLVAALIKAKASTPEAEQLVAAASTVARTHAAYPTIAYHLARLSREAGRFADSRSILDDAALQASSISQSSKNLLATERMLAAASIEEFAANLARQPAEAVDCYYRDCYGLYGQADPPQTPRPILPQFDALAAMLLNWGLPSEVLLQVAESGKLPANLQKRLLLALWSRAVLLGQREVTEATGEQLRNVDRRLATYVDQYKASSSPQERSFVVAFTILHFPGLRAFVEGVFPRGPDLPEIDNYRDNWWCADVGGLVESPSHFKDWEKDDATLRANAKLTLPDVPFLSSGQKQAARAERQRLLAIGEAVRYLPRFVIDWARTHPQDVRSPEALHYAVRSMRYGCNAQDYDQPNLMSQEAFVLLHKMYAGSSWAKKTPYWFD